MKIITTQPVETEVSAMKIILPVRYEEEDIPNDFPFRYRDTWEAIVDIDTGKIRLWPQGKSGKMYMKVVDSGCYYLLDKNGREVAAIEGDYVPRCIPGEYGDYVDFDIDENGIIANWSKKCTEDKVVESFFKEED